MCVQEVNGSQDCKSHYLSHFAVLFIVAGAKRSIAESYNQFMLTFNCVRHTKPKIQPISHSSHTPIHSPQSHPTLSYTAHIDIYHPLMYRAYSDTFHPLTYRAHSDFSLIQSPQLSHRVQCHIKHTPFIVHAYMTIHMHTHTHTYIPHNFDQ